MKKLVFIMPLMAISLLASCGGNNPTPEEVKFSATSIVTLDKTKTKANISLDWTPTNHSIECTGFTFTLTSQSDIGSTIDPGELGSHPLNLAITFDTPLDIGDEGDLKFHYNDKTAKKEGDGEIKGINVKRALEDCTWKEINEISKSGKAKETFKIGDTKTVEVNNKNHTIRIIGFNHDYSELPDEGKPDSNKVLGITFEFANVITKSNGDVATTKWNNEQSNYDYRKSTLNNFLNNDILNMLPSSGDLDNPNLKEVIKPVDKKVGVHNGTTYVATSFDGSEHPYPYLFPLAYDETTNSEEYVTEGEGTKYQYYLDHLSGKDRIKKKVDGSGNMGENYWLRSPYTRAAFVSWYVNDSGYMSCNYFVDYANGIAPAFCI